jgi:hypothetical protein
MSDTCPNPSSCQLPFSWRGISGMLWHENGLQHCVIKCEVNSRLLRSKERVCSEIVTSYNLVQIWAIMKTMAVLKNPCMLFSSSLCFVHCLAFTLRYAVNLAL